MEKFSALLVICARNSPVAGEFPAQRPMTRSFDIFFDLLPNKRLSNKQWWSWWFETPSSPLWRHCNVPVSTLTYFHGILLHVCISITATSNNHQDILLHLHLDCLFSCLRALASNETLKLHITGHLWRESTNDPIMRKVSQFYDVTMGMVFLSRTNDDFSQFSVKKLLQKTCTKDLYIHIYNQSHNNNHGLGTCVHQVETLCPHIFCNSGRIYRTFAIFWLQDGQDYIDGSAGLYMDLFMLSDDWGRVMHMRPPQSLDTDIERLIYSVWPPSYSSHFIHRKRTTLATLNKKAMYSISQ